LGESFTVTTVTVTTGDTDTTAATRIIPRINVFAVKVVITQQMKEFVAC
jgi:hypothetical protein